MNFTVVNHNISLGHIDVRGVAAASVFLVGDTNTITLSSIFDTPPESVIIGPFVPLVTEDE